ncbi:lipoate protein ligase C-terminal domain-containing protein [Staphylothermus hellenicus]|uniref:lipoate--protein ligase n=1 Tax=Staphylothermus hellenicus (strain DSM 12710 / JCM 10830 / BK20S6-10-b1 / P8) TaxID=591019 RepID=D7DC60_STAHD|nr:lipoate protein ligase C-terminal domain-containing protein [Staphylothermus hellenicus]ADI31757.1 hypothetical protein Shell_0633 [Staphylothermus hellenicus DSM 12710]
MNNPIKKSITYRVPGGKTLKIDVEIKDNTIIDIIISGDFFAYPEEGIELLENDLKGKTINEAIRIIDDYRDKIKLLGISLENIKNILIKIFHGVS